MKSTTYSKMFYILLALGGVVNIVSYLWFKKATFTWDWIIQLFGLFMLVGYQIAIHKNKPKLIGISGIIIDVIQIAILVYSQVWGLALTYCFGIITEFYLTIKGKDKFINKVSIKTYLIQLLLILILAIIMYIYLHSPQMNIWTMVFDLISTILVPVAYYLQAKQVRSQFVFWITSDVTGLVPMILIKDTYSIIAFIFYIIFDSLNALKWFVYSDDIDIK